MESSNVNLTESYEKGMDAYNLVLAKAVELSRLIHVNSVSLCKDLMKVEKVDTPDNLDVVHHIQELHNGDWCLTWKEVEENLSQSLNFMPDADKVPDEIAMLMAARTLHGTFDEIAFQLEVLLWLTEEVKKEQLAAEGKDTTPAMPSGSICMGMFKSDGGRAEMEYLESKEKEQDSSDESR